MLPIGIALVAASVAYADFYPIALTPGSYNADVVVEKNAAPGPIVPNGYTTASMDGGTNNNGDTWHEQGFFINESPVVSGLPPAGTTITSAFNANHLYQFAPSYVGPNAVMLDASWFTNCNLKVTAPANYGALTFLASGGNGGCVFRVTVKHADGSSELVTNNAPDWFFSANPAYTANGRCNAQSFTSDNYNSANPRLYERDNTLANTTSPVTNLFFEFISGNGSGHSGILAISGQDPSGGNFNPIAVTGYNADIVVEAAAGPTSGALSNYVTVTMDGGTNRTGNTWYERGFDTFHPLSGIPAAGTILDSTNLPNHHYLMPADYTVNNAIYCESNNPSVLVTFATPTNLTGLAFLSANANGNITVQTLINHADLTVETNTFLSRDWFNNTPAAYTANGRVNVGNRIEDSVLPGTSNPRLYEAQFNLKPNATSPVTSVQFNWTTNGNPSASARLVIFAVSGTTNPVPPLVATQPVSVKTNPASVVVFTASASGTAPITYQWQKGTNGVFVNLTDGGNISGSLTTTLTLNTADIPDEADYRMVASNVAGNGNSQVASLIILSTLADIPAPGDPITAYQPNGGSSPGAETVDHSIDDSTSKYLNFGKNGGNPFAGPVGFITTPSFGRSRVTVMRLYTANDAPERDPATVTLEGSDDGGASYTLITSNNITMPDARNAGGTGLDPINQNIVQIRFNNTSGYTTYRWSVWNVKNNGTANSMQVGEVELLGVADTSGKPTFTTQPVNTTAYSESALALSAAANGTPAPSLRWQKGTNGVYVALTDGGRITGSQTGNLNINPTHFTDVADYICIAQNTSGSTTSSVARVSIVSTLLDVTTPGDPITSFGDQSLGFWGANADPLNAIDDLNTVKYQNGGSGFSASAGFPPFSGPVGVVVTPSVGATRVVGMRIYTADGNVERDPVDYIVEGSNDGTTFHTLSSGALNLPLARADNTQAFDPIHQPMQEVLFPTPAVDYTSYRVTFNHTRDNSGSGANSLQIGELELLGAIKLTLSPAGGGAFTITPTAPGELQSTTALTSTPVWVDEGPISPTSPVTITPNPGTPIKLYRVVNQ
jgi:hypothetical protein